MNPLLTEPRSRRRTGRPVLPPAREFRVRTPCVVDEFADRTVQPWRFISTTAKAASTWMPAAMAYFSSATATRWWWRPSPGSCSKTPLASKLLLNPQQAFAAQALAAHCPGNLDYVFFCNSGAEATEAGLKLARAQRLPPHAVDPRRLPRQDPRRTRRHWPRKLPRAVQRPAQ